MMNVYHVKQRQLAKTYPSVLAHNLPQNISYDYEKLRRKAHNSVVTIVNRQNAKEYGLKTEYFDRIWQTNKEACSPTAPLYNILEFHGYGEENEPMVVLGNAKEETFKEIFGIDGAYQKAVAIIPFQDFMNDYKYIFNTRPDDRLNN